MDGWVIRTVRTIFSKRCVQNTGTNRTALSDVQNRFSVMSATAVHVHVQKIPISCLNCSALSVLDHPSSHSVSLMSGMIYLLILLTSLKTVS